VFSTDERLDGERRVQYHMFMQVLAVETGEILFQNKTSVTKR
jgi:PBP1b-binding outer membrane lipoprotein LpoB